MTAEEQQALVQFFGTVHAQAKQTDQMIVGSSQFVKPVSPQIQHQLEQALTAPRPVQVSEPVFTQQVIHNVQEVLPAREEQPQLVNNAVLQSVDHTDITTVLKEINLNLSRIADIIENRYNDGKRTKNTKSI